MPIRDPIKRAAANAAYYKKNQAILLAKLHEKRDCDEFREYNREWARNYQRRKRVINQELKLLLAIDV